MNFQRGIFILTINLFFKKLKKQFIYFTFIYLFHILLKLLILDFLIIARLITVLKMRCSLTRFLFCFKCFLIDCVSFHLSVFSVLFKKSFSCFRAGKKKIRWGEDLRNKQTNKLLFMWFFLKEV